MSFQCQRDSYLQRFITTVVSCEQAEHNSQRAYEVVLKDTVLFPEGGGQVYTILFLCRIYASYSNLPALCACVPIHIAR